MKKRSILSILKGLYCRFLHHLARHCFPSKFRIFLHRRRGVKIGKNVLIGLDVHIDDDGPQLVTIEDNVFLTAGCFLLTHQRDLNQYKRGDWIGEHPLVFKPIVIKEGAHIGVRTVILPGVTVGKGAIVGAGSVVTKSIPDYAIAVGVPAKVIRLVD